MSAILWWVCGSCSQAILIIVFIIHLKTVNILDSFAIDNRMKNYTNTVAWPGFNPRAQFGVNNKPIEYDQPNTVDGERKKF